MHDNDLGTRVNDFLKKNEPDKNIQPRNKIFY